MEAVLGSEFDEVDLTSPNLQEIVEERKYHDQPSAYRLTIYRYAYIV